MSLVKSSSKQGANRGLKRRKFLVGAGVAAGAGALARQLPLNVIEPAQAADPVAD
ncbi:twin-arginine translocation signal domain-containing protein, partial [Escherichia coli]